MQFGEMTPNGPAQQDAEECLSQARTVAHVHSRAHSHSHAATMGPKRIGLKHVGAAALSILPKWEWPKCEWP